MELKPGYKQTEVGVIPDDWLLTTIGATCDFENGDRSGNYPPPGSFVHSGVPFINAGHLADGRIDISEMDFISPDRYHKLGGGKVRPRDLLFCLRGSLGKYGLVNDDFGLGAIASSLVIIRPRRPTLDLGFLASYLGSSLCRRMIARWAGGAAQPNLGAQDLSRFLLALPPTTSEQRSIATALSDVDALIGALDQLIAKKRDLKQAAMQQLLTGHTRLPGFTGEWEMKKVSDIAEVGRGRVISHREINSSLAPNYPVYSSQTFNNGVMGFLDTFNFDGEYVTWTTDGVNAGKVFYRNGKFNCTNVCGTLKILNHCSRFVALSLDRVTPKYVSKNLANPKLMNGVMKQIEVFLPCSVDEQIAISTVLSDMDAEIKIQREKQNSSSKV